jgi:hypothetical protein
MRQEHFDTRGTKLLEKQARGDASYVQPEPNLVFEERKRLVTLLFKNRDVDEISDKEVQADRMETIHNIISLDRNRIPLDRPRRKTAEEAVDCVKMPEKYELCQCLDCFHDESLPYQVRIFTYKTQATFRKYVEREHFSECGPDELRSCPACDIMLESEMHFKNHALTAYGVRY